MKLISSSLAVLALSAQHVSAFPALAAEGMIKTRSDNNANAEIRGIEAGCPHKREAGAPETGSPVKRQAAGVTPPFNAASQYVSNTGANAFVAPGPGDQRGPCPGLNAMANHGYMPHNGIGTIQQFTDGTEAAFGMGILTYSISYLSS